MSVFHLEKNIPKSSAQQEHQRHESRTQIFAVRELLKITRIKELTPPPSVRTSYNATKCLRQNKKTEKQIRSLMNSIC